MTDDELERMLVLDGGPGPALAIDAARADAIVEAALAGAGFGPGGGGGTGGGGMALGTKLGLFGAAALAVVAIVLLVGRDKPEAARAPAPIVATPVIPDAAIDAAITATVTVERPIEPPVVAPPETTAPPKAKPHPEKPDDLLSAANAKRAAKKWRESDVLYARVVKLAPKSLAAQTALVASASLHLEHLGDPRGAAQRFRHAISLAPNGPVAEDARWGLAEAERANHDNSGEAAALDDFLRHHRDSPLAPRAKARRLELR